jgi:aspartyl-tRNA(Asn)/glutamyl-tRNA(Gln) amidotransferase subunit C
MISDKDIKHLAALARLELAEEEKNVIRRDLAAILAYVAELEQALPDTEAAVVGQSEERNILREDISLPAAEQPAELLAAAPRTENNYFKVKRVR